ncbi:MAG: DUF736 family protein, partial [Alphaproteobacteria bacterium]|nr:DUF736 family protein [Alphaproteobacteria bacterium]
MISRKTEGAQLPDRQSHQDRRCRVWRGVEEAQRRGPEYLSVRLDDPALTQPLNCALVEQSDD